MGQEYDLHESRQLESMHACLPAWAAAPVCNTAVSAEPLATDQCAGGLPWVRKAGKPDMAGGPGRRDPESRKPGSFKAQRATGARRADGSATCTSANVCGRIASATCQEKSARLATPKCYEARSRHAPEQWAGWGILRHIDNHRSTFIHMMHTTSIRRMILL